MLSTGQEGKTLQFTAGAQQCIRLEGFAYQLDGCQGPAAVGIVEGGVGCIHQGYRDLPGFRNPGRS